MLPNWSRVYQRLYSPVNVLFLRIFLVLLLLLVGTFPVPAEDVIYLRNQPVHLRSEDSGMVLPLSAVRHLLTSKENKRLIESGDTLTVKDSEGESKTFPLVYGAVAEWEEMLVWLGYNRRINPDTGTIDFYTSGTNKRAKEAWSDQKWENDSAAKKRSERRPGYKRAKENYEKIIAKIPLGGTDQQKTRVKRLGRAVAAQSPLADLHWTFEIIETRIPNALCTGEGFVMVTTGLLDLRLTDDELAGVLGHEVAHGVRRHAILYEERFRELISLKIKFDKLSLQLRDAEQREDLHSIRRIKAKGRAMVPRADFLLDFLKNKQSYDQHEEEEADVLGITYAAGAGFDPDGEARALTKLRKRSVELFGQSLNESNRTHPPLERRLEILSLVQARWRKERGKASRRR